MDYPVAEMAKEVVQKILTPETPPKQTKKHRIEADAEAMRKQRVMEYLRKNGAKNNQ